MITLQLEKTDSLKEGEVIHVKVLNVDKQIVQGEEMQMDPGVPVNEKLREAFKTIRYNFRARERLGNLIHVLAEQKGTDPKTVWGPLIEDLVEIKNVLEEAGVGGQAPIEPRREPWFKEDFLSVQCSCEGCEEPGVFLHANCHIGYPTWAEFRDGMIVMRCSVCDKPVTGIAVASREANTKIDLLIEEYKEINDASTKALISELEGIKCLTTYTQH